MKRPTALAMVIVLTGALCARVGAAVVWQCRVGDRFFFGDSESYWFLGRAIAMGLPYEYGSADARIFRTPGYPLALAPLFVFGGKDPPILWARLLGAVLGTAAVGGVGWIAWKLFGPRAAVAAAFFAAIEPGAVAMSVMVLSEALFCPLMVLHLALWVAASTSQEVGIAAGGGPARRLGLSRQVVLAAGAGLAAGAATLARPSWLLFTPLGVLAAVVGSRSRGRQALMGAIMLAALAAAMTPWWIRNYAVVGRFVPTTLQVGASLYDGWNPQATGASDLSVVEPIAREERTRPTSGAEAPVPYEYRLDRRLREEAIVWAWENPGQVMRLAAVKFLRIWNVWPNEAGLSTWPVRLAILGTYVPIMLLAFLGAARTMRQGWPYTVCWLPAVYFTALHMVFVGSIRYRVPAMLMLAVLAGGMAGGCPGIAAVWRWFGQGLPSQPRRVGVDCSQAGEFRLVASQVECARGGDGIGVRHSAPQPAGGS
jgi:4-amino-4-deoxy-L-arabinose transferase-like glycosyltransferase